MIHSRSPHHCFSSPLSRREERLIYQFSPESYTTDLNIGKAAPQESGASKEEMVQELSKGLVGWQNMEKQDQQKILEQMTKAIAENPNIQNDGNKLLSLQSNFNELLAKQGYNRMIEGKDGAIRFEELRESSQPSKLLEDRSVVTAHGRRPDGTELTMYKRMQIGSDGTVALTNGQRYGNIDEFIAHIKDPENGYRAVDIDYAMERIRDAQRNIREQNRYSLKSKERTLNRHRITIMRAMQRGHGVPQLQQEALARIDTELNGSPSLDQQGKPVMDQYGNAKMAKVGLRQEIEDNKSLLKAYNERVNDLRNAKREKVEANPIERRAMRQHAAEKGRQFLLGGGHDIMKEEGLEIRPGSYATVSKRPDHTKGYTEEQYAKDYRTRMNEESNRVASRLMRNQKEQLKLVKTQVQEYLQKNNNKWTGDTRVTIVGNHLEVSGNRATILIRPRFYDPSTGKTIDTANPYRLDASEIPDGGVAIDSKLVYEVIDQTLEKGKAREKLITADASMALTRMSEVLQSDRPSAATVAELVKDANGFRDPKTGKVKAKPDPSVSFPYTLLTRAVAEELTEFKGETIRFTKLDEVSEEAMKELVTLWGGKDSTLIFDNFPIHDAKHQDIARALTQFKGKVIFTGINTVKCQDNKGNLIGKYRPALDALSTGLREGPGKGGKSSYNIEGLDSSWYVEMSKIIARQDGTIPSELVSEEKGYRDAEAFGKNGLLMEEPPPSPPASPSEPTD